MANKYIWQILIITLTTWSGITIGQSPPPPPPAPPPVANSSDKSLYDDEKSTHNLLNRLRQKRDEFTVRRDRLIEQEEMLSQTDSLATQQQRTDLKRYEKKANNVYSQISKIQRQNEQLTILIEDLPETEPIKVDASLIEITIYPAVAKRDTDILPIPIIDSEDINNVEKDTAVMVLGIYDETEWRLVFFQGSLGFLKASELIVSGEE